MLTRKGEAIPHEAGPVVMKATGKVYTLLHKCPCTMPWLHYEVQDEKGRIMVVEHNDVAPLKKL